MTSIARLIPRETAEKLTLLAHRLEREEKLENLRQQMLQTGRELVEASERFDASGGFPLLFGHFDETTLQMLDQNSDRWAKEGTHGKPHSHRHRDA